MDRAAGLCIGCARTAREIAGWRQADEGTRRRIWDDLPARRARLGIGPHRLGWSAAEVRSFVASTLRPGSGTWVLGISGAVAEFCVGPGEPLELDLGGPDLVARTARAALRLAIADDVRALSLSPGEPAVGGIVVLAVPRGRADRAVPGGLVDLGPDRDAVAPGAEQRLVDLGVGPFPARFCVRTGDPGLIRDLRAHAGLRWPDLLAAAGAQILRASPTRVVTAPIGRVEVFVPIPPPGGTSPEGPHTHLLPAHLATGRETPPGIDLPEVLAPCAIYYPGAASPAETTCS